MRHGNVRVQMLEMENCIRDLRQRLTTAQAENEALRAQLKETEEKGRVLMNMCRFWKARAAEVRRRNGAIHSRSSDDLPARIRRVG